jgi:hypothetical protein
MEARMVHCTLHQLLRAIMLVAPCNSYWVQSFWLHPALAAACSWLHPASAAACDHVCCTLLQLLRVIMSFMYICCISLSQQLPYCSL